MLFIVGVVSTAGAAKSDEVVDAGAVAKENFDPNKSFADHAVSSYGYTEAFLGIIFAYGGFNQANYVSISILPPN